MPDMHFSTQVSGVIGDIHYIRSTPSGELVQSASFPAAIFYMITGSLPTPAQEKLLNAILISSMDHGVGPSSGFVPRVVASTGNNMVHSMAAGLLALGPYHGLAIDDAAKVILQVQEHGIESLQTSHFATKKRLPGLGHPHYKHTDPRSEQLFEMTRAEGLPQDAQKTLFEIQKAVFTQTGKHLVINIDGAIAAVSLDLGFPLEAANGLFAMARAAGMIAHIIEEHQEKPVRRIPEEEINFSPPDVLPVVEPTQGEE